MICNNKIIFFLLVILILTLTSSYIYKVQETNIILNGKNIKKQDKLSVYISGEVKVPGEYLVCKGILLKDLIRLAGGPKPLANLNLLNLNKALVNGDKIIVPVKERYAKETDDKKKLKNKTINNINLKIGSININNANIIELDKLPGIGEKTALKIIEYRKKQKFKAIAEIKNVSGIGDKKYANIIKYITI